MRKIYLLCMGLLLAGQVLTAQNAAISIPYSMGFEESDSLELKNWVLNPGANASRCVDQWVVGSAAKNEGRQSLYISADSGATAQFGVAKNVQYAYRDFVAPQGVYEISFDWCCMGSPDAVMYAGVGPVGNLNLEASSISSVVPNNVMSWCKQLGKLSGSTMWKNTSLRVNSNGVNVYRLFFVWASSNQDTTIAVPLAGCIDNVQMCLANCAKPKKITATSTCDSIMVQWEGTSEKYSFEFRKRGSKWSVPTIVQQESFILENMDEGMYDIRVRGICNNTDTSAYAYLNSYVLFCPEKHCINYVDLHGPNVTCTYGSYSNPTANVGVVDSGYGGQEKFYRHTVNWEPDRYDPYTCNQLPLIPDGELASVRLGNWNAGGEGEAISYQYTADIENAAILLLKYAVVLEDPGHGASANPKFSLEIFGPDGSLLSPTCGKADFAADVNRKDGGWHACGNISWKEWTTIGINLAEVGVKTGDVLTITLTTRDCAWSAHFGYAYFTLGCAAARLYGTSCGNESSMSIEAPAGFRYEWYDKYGNFVTNTQELSVDASDTTTYRCRLIYLENEECDFNLYSSLRPRFPISEFTYSYEPSNCENKVRFYNKSHIMTVFDGDTAHNYDELCEEYEWYFGTGEVSAVRNPVYVFPQKGGTYPVTLISSISEGSCYDSTTVYITLPEIGDTEQTIDTAICDGSYIVFGKWYAAQEQLYYDSLTSVAGCDSVIILDLKVNPVSKTYLPDTTVCAEVPFCIDGDCYKHASSGSFVRFKQNQYGCDSTIWMNVTMQDSILPTVTIKEPEDEPGSGTITISGKGYDYFYMNGERYDTTQTYFTGYDGGIFEFEFFNDFGCSILRSDTMNCECLQISAVEPDFVCAGDAEMTISFVIDSGIPTTYTLLFDSIAHAAGFRDQVAQKYTKKAQYIKIPIPSTATPNEYRAQLTFHNPLVQCEDIVLDMLLPLHFPADVIFQRWDDVLSLKGETYNGGYTFTAFQWLKDGQPISGATRSYYYEEGGLDMESEYQVEVELPGGVRLSTCAFTPQPYNAPQQQPKKIIENQRLVIIMDGVRYNAQGNKIDKQ